jgi:DNA-binding MarR family transcriptional regulator
MSKQIQALDDLFDNVSLGAPENAIGFVLWRVLHRYVREIDQALEAVGLTHLQFTTLIMMAWLSRSGERVTQSMLARAANIHAMQISHMLKALEGKGLISRKSNESDVRAKSVEVTAPGVRALRRALPLVMDVQRRLFGEEGRVDGSLLIALLRIEAAAKDAMSASDAAVSLGV